MGFVHGLLYRCLKKESRGIEVLHGSHVAWQEQKIPFPMGKEVLSYAKYFHCSCRFTVITPPRYNAPDMTPPTTRHKERRIFSTRLKNEAAYICDDHGFILNSKCHDDIKISLSLCLPVRGRRVGGVISWGRHDQLPSCHATWLPCKTSIADDEFVSSTHQGAYM